MWTKHECPHCGKVWKCGLKGCGRPRMMHCTNPICEDKTAEANYQNEYGGYANG